MRSQPTAPIQRRPELEPGALLRDKYRIEGILGQGGMGVVLEALHLDLERRVAIKVLHSELRENEEIVERFVREGRAAAKIEGDHVARVFDVDRLADGTPFLVMEYLDGQDLSFVRRTKTPLPIRDAVNFVLQASAAIGQAHASGVIHRDVKPANLFLTRLADGSTKIKVLDFGISKLSNPLDASQPSMTRTTLIMGSVEYMSPEQMLSTRNVDVRTDVWALGVVLFELLTASAPFSGETVTQVCAHVMSQPPAAPRSLRRDLPEAIEAVILRCLEKERDRRFATVDDLIRALRATTATTNLGLGPPTLPSPDASAANAPSSPCITGPFHPVTAEQRQAMPTAILPGIGSGHGSSTSVGVASDPIPQLPKKAAVGLVAACLLGVVTMIAGGALIHSRMGALAASSNQVSAAYGETATTTGLPSPFATSSTTAGISVEPALAASSPSVSAPAPAAGSASASAATKQKRPSESKPTSAGRPTPKASPRKPSGID